MGKEGQPVQEMIHESQYVQDAEEWKYEAERDFLKFDIEEDELEKDGLEGSIAEDDFFEDVSYDDDNEESLDGEDDSDQPDEMPDQLPEISDEENKLVDDWWKEYKQMNDTAKEREHLVAFMNQYPHLTDHLRLWYEVLYEMAADHFREGMYETFVDLLLRIREEFPYTYRQRFDIYESLLIYWYAAQGRWDEVDPFFTLFGRFGNNNGTRLHHLITFFKAFNRPDIPLRLLKDTKSHEAILSIIENDIESRYLDTPVTDESVQSLVDEMEAADVLNMDISKEEILIEWKRQLLEYTRPFTLWEEHLSRKRTEAFRYYLPITNNFAYFLYKRYGLSFVTAYEYSYLLSEYYSQIFSDKKIPKSFFCLDKEQIAEHITMERFLLLNSQIDMFVQLNALYYFTDYLRTCGNLAEDRKCELQEMIANIYHETFLESRDDGPEMLLFAKFPLWKMKEQTE